MCIRDRIQPDLDICPGRAVRCLPRRTGGHSLPRRSLCSQYTGSHRRTEFRATRRSCLVTAGSHWQLDREASRRTRNHQHPHQFRQFLYGHRCAIDWCTGRECALRHHLHQSRAAVICNTVYLRGQRPELRTALPLHLRPIELFAQPSRRQL